MTVQPFPLDAALGIPGARAVALLDAGAQSVVWSAGAPALGADEMAAVITLAGAAAGLVALSEPADELGDVLVTSAAAFHVLRLVGDGSAQVAYLMLRRAGANLAMARHEFRQLIRAHARGSRPRHLAEAEPVGADPVGADLVGADLVGIEPAGIEPVEAGAEPVEAGAEPMVTESIVAEPIVAEPILAEPILAELVHDQPMLAELVRAEPPLIEPPLIEPLLIEPVLIEREDVEPQPPVLVPARMVLVPDQHVPESATALLPELGPNRRPEFGSDLGPNLGPEFSLDSGPEFGPGPGTTGTNLGPRFDFATPSDDTAVNPSPAVTDPDATDPDSTGPDSTGPDSTGPHGTGPHGTGPQRNGPDPTDPDITDPDAAVLPRRRPNAAPIAANGSPAGNTGPGNEGIETTDGTDPSTENSGTADLPPLPDWLTVLGQPYQNDEGVLDRILVSLRHL